MPAIPNLPPELKQIFDDLTRRVRNLEAIGTGVSGGNFNVGGTATAHYAPVVQPDGKIIWTAIVQPSDLSALVGLPETGYGLRSLDEVAAFLNIIPLPPVSITTASLPSGVNGTPYSQSLAATGGTGSFTWSVISGALPTGLSLSGSTISGTPSSTASFTFTVQASSGQCVPDTQQYTVNIAANNNLAFTMPTATPTIGLAFSLDVAPNVHGGTPPYSYTSYGATVITGASTDVTFNTLLSASWASPDGTSVALTGLSGTTGISNNTRYFSVNGTNGTGCQLALTLGGTPIDLTGSNQSGTVTIHFPSLPNKGLSLSGSVISAGTGGVTGTAGQTPAVAVTVTDSAGSPATVESSATWTLVGPNNLAVTTTSLPPAQVGVAYSATLAATGGVLPYAWAANFTLPSWATLNASTAVISGTPDTSGTITGTYTVTDSTSGTPLTATSGSLSIVVAPSTSTLSIVLPDESPTIGSAFSYDASTGVTGGTAPYTYTSKNSAGAATLPNKGLSLSGSTISATSVTGTAGQAPTVAITVTDSSSPAQTATDTAVYTLQSAGTTWAFAQTNLASICTVGAGASEAQAQANTAAINQAIHSMANQGAGIHQGRIYFDNGTATSGSPAIIMVSGKIQSVMSSGVQALNQWGPFDNLILRETPQPMFAEGGSDDMVYIQGATAPTGLIQVDGNGANQHATDMTRVPSATSNRWGYYSNGVSVWQSGSSDGTPTGTINGVSLDVVALNMRGVTGSSHNTFDKNYAPATQNGTTTGGCTISGNQITGGPFNGARTSTNGVDPASRVASVGSGEIPSNTWVTAISSDKKTLTVNRTCTAGTHVNVAVGVDNVECFDYVRHGCFGGDDVVVTNKCLDGPYVPTVWDNGAPYCSGDKTHYTQQNGNNTPPPWSQILITGDTRRHIWGGYSGGRLLLKKGSTLANSEHGINVEEGIANGSNFYNGNGHTGPGCHETWDVVIGGQLVNGAPDTTDTSYDQVVSTNCGIGCQFNGNGNASLQTANLYGYTSHNDTTGIECDGDAPLFVKVWGQKMITPDRVGVKFNGSQATTAASNFHVASNGANASKIHLTGSAVKTQGGSYNTGTNGDWTTDNSM